MQLKLHMVTIEDLVPKGHFLRKLMQYWILDLYIRKQLTYIASGMGGRPSTRWCW